MTTKEISRRKKVVLSIIVCAIILGGLELISRVTLPFPLGTEHTYTSDPKVLYFHRPKSRGWEVAPHNDFSPSFVEYDELGFRGKSSTKSDKPTIAVIGDSFVEARQVKEEKTFVWILADKIKGYNFVNGGCSGYTTTTEFLLLKNRILALKPKKVFLFFAFNDYADNFIYQEGYFRYSEIFTDEVPPAQLIPILAVPAPLLETSVLKFLQANSAIIANMARWLRAKPEMRLAVPRYRSLFQHSFKAVNTPTEELDNDGRMVLQFTHKGLEEIAALTKRENIGLTVFIIPSPMQVSSREWSPGKTGYYGYRSDETDDSVVYQSRLMDFCKSVSLVCVDLLPDFRASVNSGATLFLPYDGHFTEEAHAVVASVVARYLVAPQEML